MQAGVRATMFIVLVVAFVVASGCTDTETIPLAGVIPATPALPPGVNISGASQGVAGGGGGGNGSLYVADPLANAVFRFNASDTGADVTPQAIIRGPTTQLQQPTQVALDATRNRLYVVDAFRVLVFDNPKALTGDVAPTRVFTSTTLGLFSIAIDETRDVLYLGHGAGIGITSYDNASSLTGAVTPQRILSGANTQIGTPLGLLSDTSNRLFATDVTSDGVLIYDNANTRTGNVAPDRLIQGAQTGFLDPFGLAFDSVGNLFVGDISSDSISIFSNGAAATGNIAPTFIRSSAQTALVDPRQMVIRDGTSLIIADGVDGSVRTYLTQGMLNGVTIPVRVILAPTAGMSIPTGVAHDPNR